MSTVASSTSRRGALSRPLHGTNAVAGLVCVVAITLLWIAVVRQARFERQQAIATAIERNANLAVAFEQFSVRTIDSADTVARYVRREYARLGSGIDIAGLLADRTVDSRIFTAISIVDARGHLVATSFDRVPDTPLNITDRPHFTVHIPRDTDRAFIGQPILSRLTGKSTVPISRRINNPDGSFGGIVSVQIEPSRFTEFFGTAALRPQDTIALVGLDGISRARRVGDTHSSGESVEGGRLLEQQKLHPSGDIRAPGRLDGLMRFYSYRTLRNYPLVVTVGVPEADILQPARQRRARYYSAAAVVSVLMAGLAGLLIAALDRHQRAVVELERTMDDLQAVHGRLAEQASLLDKAQDAIVVRDLDRRITYWNKGAERMYGWSAPEIVGSVADGLDPDPAALADSMTRVTDHGDWVGEIQQVRKDGTSLTAETRWTLVRDESGRPSGVLMINTDVTERTKLQQQFLRAQRLESIGTLAGGMAHDLNNVLTPIMMAVGMLSEGETDPERLELLSTLETSARRGADMVQQVLSFARGVEGRRESVHPPVLLREVEQIVHDTFLKNIDVRTRIPEDLWTVSGDPIQLHQVLLNLCVNARDAMPQGGLLLLTAANVSLDAAFTTANLDARPGPHVLLQVRDSGSGIPADAIGRIFEPFFTTKDVTQGTGLGLSTSLAIVKSHGGFIRVDSLPGHGATFSVYLPARPGAPREAPPEQVPTLPRGHGELILVVDDEAPVRLVTRRMLEAFGYQVLLAANGAEAVDVFSSRRHEIAAVITDMMMPVMDGPATIRALRTIAPDTRIIAASGLHGHDPAADAGTTDVLAKPYTAETLLVTLRRVLSA